MKPLDLLDEIQDIKPAGLEQIHIRREPFSPSKTMKCEIVGVSQTQPEPMEADTPNVEIHGSYPDTEVKVETEKTITDISKPPDTEVKVEADKTVTVISKSPADEALLKVKRGRGRPFKSNKLKKESKVNNENKVSCDNNSTHNIPSEMLQHSTTLDTNCTDLKESLSKGDNPEPKNTLNKHQEKTVNKKTERGKKKSSRKGMDVNETGDTAVLNNNDQSDTQNQDGSANVDRTQPSILSMFQKRPCKRLGMRGGVKRKERSPSDESQQQDGKESQPKLDEVDGDLHQNLIRKSPRNLTTKEKTLQKCKNSLKTNIKDEMLNTKENTVQKYKTDLKTNLKDEILNTNENCTVRSPRKILDINIRTSYSPLKNIDLSSNATRDSLTQSATKRDSLTQSPVKQALVKLENCDHVCDSPKKSVSAEEAEKSLTPLKTLMNTHSLSPVGSAKHKLDFSELSTTPLSGSVIKRLRETFRPHQLDFVEDLFMGKMMLRTKCLECEMSKERIEEFHDIAVPVRNEADNDDTDDEEETNQSSGKKNILK